MTFKSFKVIVMVEAGWNLVSKGARGEHSVLFDWEVLGLGQGRILLLILQNGGDRERPLLVHPGTRGDGGFAEVHPGTGGGLSQQPQAPGQACHGNLKCNTGL